MKSTNFFLLFLLVAFPALGGNERVLIPYVLGDGDSLLPFGLRSLGVDSMRYQQVYLGDDLATVNPSGVWVHEIRFRDNAGRDWSANLPLIQINLSTTARAPDSLSPVFAENIGADDTVVFGPDGNRFGSSQDTYGTLLPMEQSFFYDPSQGNLLLDVRVFMPEEPYEFQLWRPQRKQTLLGDPVSSVYAFDVNATEGTVDTTGLVTMFVVQVPEPSIASITAVALIPLALLHWRQKTKKGVRVCQS